MRARAAPSMTDDGTGLTQSAGREDRPQLQMHESAPSKATSITIETTRRPLARGRDTNHGE
jgi:hypothetical protein